MASNDMAEAIRQLVQTKGLSEEQVFKTIEDAIKAAYKKKFGSNDNVVVKIEPEGAGLSVYSSKIIVDRDQMLEEDVEEIPVQETGGENPIDFTGSNRADPHDQ